MGSKQNEKFGFLDFIEFLRGVSSSENNFSATLKGMLIPFIMLGVGIYCFFNNTVYSLSKTKFFEGVVYKFDKDGLGNPYILDCISKNHNYGRDVELGHTMYDLAFTLRRDTILYNCIEDKCNAKIWYMEYGPERYIVQFESDGKMVRKYSLWFEFYGRGTGMFWFDVIAVVLCLFSILFVIIGIRKGRKGNLSGEPTSTVRAN